MTGLISIYPQSHPRPPVKTQFNLTIMLLRLTMKYEALHYSPKQSKACTGSVPAPFCRGPAAVSNALKIGENGHDTQTTSPRELTVVNMKECLSSASNKVQNLSHLTPSRLLFHRVGPWLRNEASTIPQRKRAFMWLQVNTKRALETCFVWSYLCWCCQEPLHDEMKCAMPENCFSSWHFSLFLITGLFSVVLSIHEFQTFDRSKWEKKNRDLFNSKGVSCGPYRPGHSGQ